MFRTALFKAAALTAALASADALAYKGEIHQQLTFISAQAYNRCVDSLPAGSASAFEHLTPLQVRYIAKANANQADQGWWQRMFHWNYYDRGGHSSGRVLWLIETRLHNRFTATLQSLDEARELSRRFTDLGRVVNHLQDATTPAVVVPVFTARWWRFSVSDRFSGFPVDGDALLASLGDDCVSLRAADGTFESLLERTAERTIASIDQPIEGMPATWQAFWELDDEDSFGSFGNAGNNFGRETAFRCTEDETRTCVLLDGDPLYAQYARERHLDAVRATIAAVAMTHRQAGWSLSPEATNRDLSPAATNRDHSPEATSRDLSPEATSRDHSPEAASRSLSPEATSRNRSPEATNRDLSPAATSRDRSPAAASRDRSPAATNRDHSPAATSRSLSPAATRRDHSPEATNRDRSPAATSRDHSPAATSRDHSPAAASRNHPPEAASRNHPPEAASRDHSPEPTNSEPPEATSSSKPPAATGNRFPAAPPPVRALAALRRDASSDGAGEAPAASPEPAHK